MQLHRFTTQKKWRTALKKIDLSSRHLLTLVNEVLDLSRIEKGKVKLEEESFSLGKLIEDVGVMIRAESEGKGQELSLNACNLAHDRLIGDTRSLRQVLLNLLTNAVKYTPNGGRIRLNTQEVSQRKPGVCKLCFYNRGFGNRDE